MTFSTWFTNAMEARMNAIRIFFDPWYYGVGFIVAVFVAILLFAWFAWWLMNR